MAVMGPDWIMGLATNPATVCGPTLSETSTCSFLFFHLERTV